MTRQFDAIIVGAALLNALSLVGKDIAKVKLVVSGAGAAALSCLGVLEELGLPREAIQSGDVARVRGLMDVHGSIEYGRAIAHGCAGAALHEFSVAFAGVPPSADRDFIEQLCTWVLRRA